MEVLAESWRWLRSSAGRTSCLLVGATIAATLLVTWGGQFSREVARERETGKLMVVAGSTLMVAELAGDDVLKRFSVPTIMPIEAPAGDYQLRIGPLGKMTRTYDITLAGERRVVVRVDEDDRELWRHDAAIDDFVAVNRPNSPATDIVVADTSGLRRLDGATGQAAWTVDFVARQESLRELAPGFAWADGRSGVDRQDRYPTARVTLVSAGDLNGDQFTDVVVASHRQAWLVAVSGRDGSVLWLAARDALINAPEDVRRRYARRSELRSAVIGAPQRAGDLDGDGAPDLVATMIDQRKGASAQPPEALARWVEAVSGATGESLWRFEFAEAAFQLPAGIEPPDAFRWWYDHVSRGARHHRHSSWSSNRYTRNGESTAWSGSSEFRPGVPHVVAYQDAAGVARQQVVVIAGHQLVTLNAETGVMEHQVNLKQPPAAALRLADVDGDAIDEVILLSEVAAPPNSAVTTLTDLAVHSLTLNKVLWSRTLLVGIPNPGIINDRLPDWPLVEDLDGDRRSEIVLPGDAPLGNVRDLYWGRVQVLDGETGKPRWNRQLFSVDPQIDTFIIGPDIDGDGQREVFTATLWGRMMELYVDCLSGLDGHTLWRARRQIRLTDDIQDFYVGRLSWWEAGGDGWPQLIVPVTGQSGYLSPTITLVSAGTGDITQTCLGIGQTHPVDVDGDGWDELLTFAIDLDRRQTQLGCLAGIAADRRHWPLSQTRQTDTQDHWFPVADFDRDGVDDLVRVRPDGWVHAISGETGSLLWKRRESALRDHRSIAMAQHARGDDQRVMDVNGDQVPDIAIGVSGNRVNLNPPLLVLSGSDGRRLWHGGPDVKDVERDMTILLSDLDGDGRGELIMVASVAPRGPRPRGGRVERQTVFVVDGRSGNVRWQQPLQLTRNLWHGKLAAHWLNESIADFNGDGTSDLALPAEAESGANTFEVRGYDGAAGRLLWTVPLQTSPRQRGFDSLLPVLTCDANGDRKADLLVLDSQDQSGNIGQRIRLVDGADGSIQWTSRRKNTNTRLSPRIGGPQLLRLRDPTKGTRFCLNYATSPDHLEIIDSQGAWQPTPAADPRNRQRKSVGLWVCDPDADGTDELLMLDQETLRLVAVDDVSTPLWERTLAGSRDAFENLSWSQDPARGVAVIYDTDARQLDGVDLVDGSSWWTCRLGSQFVRDVRNKQLDVLTSQAAPRRAPQILANGFTETLLRQATGVMPIEGERLASRPPPTLQSATSDARMARQLPWYFDVSAGHRQLSLGFAVWAAASCLMLLVLPVAFVARMIRRRKWGLRTMLAAPGVVAVVLVVSRMNVPAWADSQFPNNLTMGMAALPMVTLAYLIGRAVGQRKWRDLLVIVVVFAVTTLGLAALLLTMDVTQSKPWQRGEYYVLDGWYLIAWQSIYLTGWLSVVIFLAGYFVRPNRGRGTGAASRT